MDPEEVAAAPEESVMEKVAALKLETPEDSAEPENPPAAEEEAQQPAVNGHSEQVPEGPPEKDLDSLAEPEPSSEKVSDLAQQRAVPEGEPQPADVQPQAEPEPPSNGERAEPVTDPGAEVQEVIVVEACASPVVEAAASASPVVEAEASASPVVEAEASASPVVEAAASASPVVEVAPADKPAEADQHAAAADVGSELVHADRSKEEDPDPASGSLSFAVLERDETRDALRLSRVLVVLRGLPGSGKSFLARAIAAAYADHCSIVSADDHGIRPESPELCADGYRALDDAVVACCGEGTSSSVLIVVDDTNHTLDRLVRLGQLAEQHHLVSVFLEPQTEWSRDPEQLSSKTRRGLEAATLEAMKAPLLEVSLPLYFGWFLLSTAQDKVKCMALDFVKTLDTLDAFKKHLMDFTGKAEAEVDLEHYFQSKGTLHCTTKFCNYGKADGAKEYAENQAVQDSYGAVSELSLSALFVTPRTVGARVSLGEEQLQVWPADVDSSLPPGSRAHVTLGCAEGVEPVQTGLDLLEIVALQQEGQQGETVEEMELGRLAYYGAGRWLLVLREPMVAPACFSSYYGPRETPAAKPDRKKKPKCSIL